MNTIPVNRHTPLTALVLGSLGLVACSGEAEDLAMGDLLRQGELELGSASTLDQAAEACASGSTLFGIDVSYYQGAINWGQVAGAGVQYAIIRVSDGTGFEDPRFAEYWSGSQAAGIPRGAYQFFRPNQDPLAQADLLIAKLQAHGAGELPPVIDVEATGDQPASVIAAKVGQWLARVEAALHVKPIIYTGFYFWRDNVGGVTDYASYPLWHAQYTSAACPRIADAWPSWAFWQYSSTGRVAGINANVDLNRFNGDRAALLGLAGPSPQCVADPNLQRCDGTVIRRCTGGQYEEGDCGFYGAGCSTAGGTAHCVHPYCMMNLDGGETGTFCVDGSEKLATCNLGTYEEGDCAAYGAICSEAGGQGHCVHFMCWSNLNGAEDGSFCVDGSEKIGSCALGAYTEGDCAAYGATCSEAGGQAHCVHFMCASHLDGGEDGSFCVDDSTAGVCELGAYGEQTCAGSEHCIEGHCVPGHELDCGDGLDEDGDARVDCEDEDCQDRESCAAPAVLPRPIALPLAPGSGGDGTTSRSGPVGGGAMMGREVLVDQGCSCQSGSRPRGSVLVMVVALVGWRCRRRRGQGV
ncbi:MAG: GH25 family lysozyme [Pseudomonadota bacterium]